MNQFVELLSPGLKTSVIHHIFQSSFQKNSFMKNKPEIISLLIKDITPFLMAPEDNVIEQG
jgi:hypothetical protein